MRLKTRLGLLLGVTAFGACRCEPEELNKPVCKFTVSPHDARADSPPGVLTGPLAFGEVQKGSSRARTISINNAESNVPLTALSVQFSQVNRDSFSLPDAIPTIAANGSGVINVVFSPIPIEGEVGNTITISHPPIEEVTCPTWTVTLRGRALPPELPDAGPGDAGPGDAARDAGEDAGRDAGPIFPRPDAGQDLGDSGHFESRGGLQTARTEFGAALLPTGEILVVGGFDSAGQTTASTEIFNPYTGLSRLGPPLTTARARHTVSVLPNGHILVAGGVSSGAPDVAEVLANIEVFNPQTMAWTQTAITERRAAHAAVVVGTQVLLAYGLTHAAAGTPLVGAVGAVLVDEAGVLAPVTGDMDATSARTGVAAVDVEDGTVLFVGGVSGAGVPLADLVRYSAGTLTRLTVQLMTPRGFAVAARFRDGPLVVSGGAGATGPVVTAEKMDLGPDPLMWTIEAVDAPVAPRLMGHALRVADDVILVGGGVDTLPMGMDHVLALQDAQLFIQVPSVGVLVAAPSNEFTVPRVFGSTVTFDGGVAVLGGSVTLPRRQARPDVDRYFPTQNRFETAGLIGPGGAATGAAPRQLFVAGGVDLSTGRASARTRLLNFETNAFAEGPRLLVARTEATATVLDDGNILVVGGTSINGDPLSHAELVAGDLSQSAVVGALVTPRRRHTATLLLDGRVLVCGGLGAGAAPLNTCEIYDPMMETFSAATGRLVRGRYDHTATLLDSGRVFLTGGNDPAIGPFAGDVFEPTDNRVHATTGFPVVARRGHAAVLVGQGRVLIVGGETFVGERVPTDTAELWSESTESYDGLMPISTPRDGPSALVFANGVTLVTGGGQTVTNDDDFPTRALSRTEVYDPGMGPLGGFRNIDMALRGPRAKALGLDVLGQPTVLLGEGRHGKVGAGVEARVPLTTVELWVP